MQAYCLPAVFWNIRLCLGYVNYEHRRSVHLAVNPFSLLCLIIVNLIRRFLMAQSYAGFICFLAWASGSVSQPPVKRASALALINCVSQFGNIAGS